MACSRRWCAARPKPRSLVAAAKYPPDGIRGFGPRRASDYGRNIDAYVTGANAATIVIPQIEDVGAAEAIDEILAVPGVDALCIGPNDLSGSAGVLRQHDHPVVRGAIDRILKAASARGVAVCTGVTLPLEQQHEWIARGARLALLDLGRRAVGRGRRRRLGRRARRAGAMTPTPPSEDRFGAADQVLRDVLDADPESGPDAPATSGMLGRLLSNRDVAILIVAVVLFALFALAGPRFLSENNLVDIARRAAILGILAVGMTYLFIAGELDLSIGSHYGFLLILMSFQEERLGIDPWLAAGVVILIGLMIGAVNGLLVTRVGLPSFITTLGMLALLRGAANAVSSGYPIPAKNTDLAFYQIIRANFPGTPIPNLFVAMLAVMLIGAIVLARTKFGSDVYATGGDVEAARNNGIDTKRREARVLRADGRICAASARRCCSAGSASRRSAPGSTSSCR